MRFNSLNEAIETFLTSRENGPERGAAFDYIIENGPPELIEKLNAIFRKHFPGLEPTHYDEKGQPYFELSRVAKYFGVSEEEIANMSDPNTGLVSAGMLHKIH